MEMLYSAFGGGSSQKETPDASATIDKLCDRVKDATLLEDRRSAVQGLRGLSREWQLVGYSNVASRNKGNACLT
jgi:hypothetical protein